jgi:hypothetical protein
LAQVALEVRLQIIQTALKAQIQFFHLLQPQAVDTEQPGTMLMVAQEVLEVEQATLRQLVALVFLVRDLMVLRVRLLVAM